MESLAMRADGSLKLVGLESVTSRMQSRAATGTKLLVVRPVKLSLSGIVVAVHP